MVDRGIGVGPVTGRGKEKGKVVTASPCYTAVSNSSISEKQGLLME